MHNYGGYYQGNYHVKTRVPTTIFEPLVAEVKFYNRRNEKIPVHTEFVPLRSLPYWSIPHQAVFLKSTDERRLIKREKEILSKLENELN